jgi:hypothetical protein
MLTRRAATRSLLWVGCSTRNDETAYVGPTMLAANIKEYFLRELFLEECTLKDWVARMGAVSRFEGQKTTKDSLARSLNFDIKARACHTPIKGVMGSVLSASKGRPEMTKFSPSLDRNNIVDLNTSYVSKAVVNLEEALVGHTNQVDLFHDHLADRDKLDKVLETKIALMADEIGSYPTTLDQRFGAPTMWGAIYMSGDA